MDSFESYHLLDTSRSKERTSADAATIRGWRKSMSATKATLKSLSPQILVPQYTLPLNVWKEHSRGAERGLRDWTLDGIENGFDIHVRDHPELPRAKVRNLPMGLGQKAFFGEWLLSNREKKSLWGPFKADQSDVPEVLKPLRVNPQGCVRKGTHFGVPDADKEWRPINHQSHPRKGVSINSQVDPEWATVCYVRFLTIIALMAFAGPGALIWAVDAKDAFLRVPIRVDCMRFMAFVVFDTLWFFTSLCFGLASAPLIYTLFADLVLWIITNKTLPDWPSVSWSFEGQRLTYHYVDDFFGVVPTRSGICAQTQFETVIAWFVELGIPTKPSKCLAPATRQKILGFLYDTQLQMVFIPQAKRDELLAAIDRVLGMKTVSQLEVLSLIGKLRWASVCIFAGAAFVRRLEQQANRVKATHMHINVQPLKKDLLWWHAQISRAADGVSFSDLLRRRDGGDIHVLTDASTGDGMGGWCKPSGDWFRYRWADHERVDVFTDDKNPDIFWKEMAAVTTACLIWGPEWKGKSVTFWIDNMSSVWTLIKRSCAFKRADIMHMVRIIMDAANENGFYPYFIHIPGKENLTADALSRFLERMFWEDTKGIAMAADETRCKTALDAIVYSHWPRKSGLATRSGRKRLRDWI